MGSILVMAQCFGLMPVVGVKGKSASELRFQWNSFRTVYAFIMLILAFFYAGMTLWITFSNEMQFDRMSMHEI